QSPHVVGPAHQARKSLVRWRRAGIAHAANDLNHLTWCRRKIAAIDAARRAVDRDPFTFGNGLSVHRKATMLDVDLELLASNDRALSHTARNDGRVARHAAARSQHCTRR